MEYLELAKFAAGGLAAYSVCRYVAAPLIGLIHERNMDIRRNNANAVFERCYTETIKIRGLTATQIAREGRLNYESICCLISLLPIPDEHDLL